MSLENLNKKFEYILIQESTLKLQKDNLVNGIMRQSVLFETYYKNFKIVSARNLSWMKHEMPIFPGGNDHEKTGLWFHPIISMSLIVYKKNDQKVAAVASVEDKIPEKFRITRKSDYAARYAVRS